MVPIGVQTLRRMRSTRPARRVGKPVFTDRRRGEIVAGVYLLGDLGVLLAWIIDPGAIGNHVGMAILMVVVLASAAALFVVGDRLPAAAGDVAVVGSVALITVADLFTRLHVHVGLFSPYYIWVGFVSPMWFSRRRALLYVTLAALAAAGESLVADTAAATAAWVTTTVTLLVAFVIVDSLTRTLVERERLAAVGEMASVVSHELRNPLGAMGNAVFLVRHSMHGDLSAEVDQHLSMAEREIEKATAIIDHLVAFVRPRLPVSEPVSMRDVVEEVLETTPAPAGVDVRVDVDGVRPLADRGHLAEILVNLVSNAFDALREGGTVRIGARVVEQCAEVTVEDDGPGLGRAISERIFEPFFTTKHTGTGLGLAIVRRLVEDNRGAVAVDSHIGQGTRFTISLPASAPDARGAKGPTDAPRPTPASVTETDVVSGRDRTR
jgi:signal transduction histidine kinase